MPYYLLGIGFRGLGISLQDGNVLFVIKIQVGISWNALIYAMAFS